MDLSIPRRFSHLVFEKYDSVSVIWPAISRKCLENLKPSFCLF